MLLVYHMSDTKTLTMPQTLKLNPNNNDDSSFSESVHLNKIQNIFQKRCCIKVSKKATSEKMLPHCFARSYIQFHLKKEVSWHLSTSTGKWPCRAVVAAAQRPAAAAFSVSVELSHFHWWCNTILTSISARRLLRHCVGSSKIKIVQDRRQPASGKYIKLVY